MPLVFLPHLPLSISFSLSLSLFLAVCISFRTAITCILSLVPFMSDLINRNELDRLSFFFLLLFLLHISSGWGEALPADATDGLDIKIMFKIDDDRWLENGRTKYQWNITKNYGKLLLGMVFGWFGWVNSVIYLPFGQRIILYFSHSNERRFEMHLFKPWSVGLEVGSKNSWIIALELFVPAYVPRHDMLVKVLLNYFWPTKGD